MADTTRRTYPIAVGSIPVVGTMVGCLGDDATGTLATQITDQPRDIADFESCVVTIVGMWLGPEDAEAGEEEGVEPRGRERYDYDEPQQADLVQLQDGETQLVDERELDTATYRFLQLDIDEIDATLTDGSAATVGVPGEAPLTFNREFEFRDASRAVFTADFTPVQRGRTDEYVLQPVPEGLTIAYKDEA